MQVDLNLQADLQVGRTSALDWFMNPVPESRCTASLETSDDKRPEGMKPMLHSRPVSTGPNPNPNEP